MEQWKTLALLLPLLLPRPVLIYQARPSLTLQSVYEAIHVMHSPVVNR